MVFCKLDYLPGFLAPRIRVCDATCACCRWGPECPKIKFGYACPWGHAPLRTEASREHFNAYPLHTQVSQYTSPMRPTHIGLGLNALTI